jgi:transposase
MSRKTNRDLFQLKHYTFLERLNTSKTCGNCGILNDIGSREMYDCKGCLYRVDRDINGSRNIMIKCIKELER